MRTLKLVVLVLVSFIQSSAFALEVASPEERENLFKNAVVWNQPPWISNTFQFSADFDLSRGPNQEGNLSLLHADVRANDDLHCVTSEEDQIFGETGMTRKFYCQLMKRDPVTGKLTPLLNAKGKREKIKVKYTIAEDENPEVYGEMLGTRLLWALGFGADQMYAIENLNCFGCTADPFLDRRVDPSTLKHPRRFHNSLVEVRLPGKEIKIVDEKEEEKQRETEGWHFEELMQILPTEGSARREALKHRDALRLLAIMIHHMDNKSDNQSIMCPKSGIVEKKCVKPAVFYIHDIGASFGVKDNWGKVDYDRWIRDPIWKDPKKCIAQLEHPDLPDESLREPVISEAGRKFLADLLKGFVSGKAGHARVKELFLSAKMDQRQSSTTVEMWVEAFLKKVDEIVYPAGKRNPDFKCPQ